MKQPEALRLADFCDGNALYHPAAAELRRLHEENQELLQAMKEVFSLEESILRDIWGSEFVEKAQAAIAKAETNEGTA